MSSAESLVYGLHTVEALLRSSPQRIRILLVDSQREDARITNLCELAVQAGVRPTQAKHGELDRRSRGGTHQGMLAVCDLVELAGSTTLSEHLLTQTEPLVIAIEGVEDPRNLGACLRTAECAGVDAVVLPRSRRTALGGVVQKAAAGALQSLFVAEVPNLSRTLGELKEQGLWVVGSSDCAETAYTSIPLVGPLVIVMGGEGRGLRRLTRDHCDHLVRIPMLGAVESLNVSVACGILLFEAIRQRNPG